MRTFERKAEWGNKTITASVLVLDNGIRVDLYGGDLSISERSVPFPVKKNWKQWYFRDTGKPC